MSLGLSATFACSLQNFDYLQKSAIGGAGGVAGSAVDSAGDAGDVGAPGGSESSAGRPVTSGGGGGGAGDVSSNAGDGGEVTGTSGSGTGGTSGSTAGGGSAGATLLGPWNFDTSDLGAWTPRSTSVTLSWVAEGSESPPGSMVCVATAQTEVEYAILGSNFAGLVLRARLRAQAGNVAVKVYSMSAGYHWADGGTQQVATDWTTLSINLDSPVFVGVDFDPTQIISFGLQITAASTILVDAIWFEYRAVGP